LTRVQLEWDLRALRNALGSAWNGLTIPPGTPLHDRAVESGAVYAPFSAKPRAPSKRSAAAAASDTTDTEDDAEASSVAGKPLEYLVQFCPLQRQAGDAEQAPVRSSLLEATCAALVDPNRGKKQDRKTSLAVADGTQTTLFSFVGASPAAAPPSPPKAGPALFPPSPPCSPARRLRAESEPPTTKSPSRRRRTDSEPPTTQSPSRRRRTDSESSAPAAIKPRQLYRAPGGGGGGDAAAAAAAGAAAAAAVPARKPAKPKAAKPPPQPKAKKLSKKAAAAAKGCKPMSAFFVKAPATQFLAADPDLTDDDDA
jgi:hypothetical protein